MPEISEDEFAFGYIRFLSWFVLLILGSILISVGNGYQKDPTTASLGEIVAASGFILVLVLLVIAVIFIGRGLFRTTALSVSLRLSEGVPDVEHAVSQLSKNYDILRRQANQGFLLACVLMIFGFIVIALGSVGKFFVVPITDSDLTTAAGVVIEAVSAFGLYIFKETSKRLNAASDNLHEMWKILAAFKQADALEGDKKTEMKMMLIAQLAGISPSAIPRVVSD